MNKQQLATKIWESANKMRSKIEANEYKDYILGFIFYKYLSDKELKFLKDNDFTDNDIKALKEVSLSQSKTVEITSSPYCKGEVEGELLPQADYRISILPQAINMMSMMEE